jgi:hypothetical protein
MVENWKGFGPSLFEGTITAYVWGYRRTPNNCNPVHIQSDIPGCLNVRLFKDAVLTAEIT